MDQMNYIARFLFDSAASCVMMIVRWMVHVWHITVVYVSTILRNLITWYSLVAYHVRKGLPGTLIIRCTSYYLKLFYILVASNMAGISKQTNFESHCENSFTNPEYLNSVIARRLCTLLAV